jgi:hypothetical protein
VDRIHPTFAGLSSNRRALEKLAALANVTIDYSEIPLEEWLEKLEPKPIRTKSPKRSAAKAPPPKAPSPPPAVQAPSPVHTPRRSWAVRTGLRPDRSGRRVR